MILLTALMVSGILVSEHLQKQEIEEKDQSGLKGYSLFEDIVIGDPGTGETANDKAEVPDALRQIRLFRTGEGKWAVWLPADLQENARISFTLFDSLRLDPADEKAGEPVTLHSRDMLAAGSMSNGSSWHAQALGKKGEVREEADIVFYCSGDIPSLYINTATGSLDAVDSDQSVREKCSYRVCAADGSGNTAGECEIHGRGNSSWKEDKKQYSLNLSADQALLGMEKSRKFALIANYSDSSFMRNKAAYDLAGLCGMPASPESVFVNVYFNGLYHGLYLMAQRPNAKGGSVRIAELEKANKAAAAQSPMMAQTQQAETESGGPSGTDNKTDTVDLVDADGLEIHAASRNAVPENITGGYLLEIDARYEEEDCWFSTKTHHFVVKYPENIPLKECEYIAGYMREAEAALCSGDGINPETGKSWEEYFDKDSWAAMYLLQDFMVQWDVESFSFFVYKDADDPHLYCGPVWDFDLSMGTTGLGNLPNVTRQSVWLKDHREGWLTEMEKFPAFSEEMERFAREQFFPTLKEYLEENSELPVPGMPDQGRKIASGVFMDARRWEREDAFETAFEALVTWMRGRSAFWQEYDKDPQSFCKVTLRYGFKDMDIYLPRGKAIGFVPTEEYGEHFYSSFRKKYGSIDGWYCEDGSVLTPETVIDKDQVLTPFSAR